VNVTIQLLLQQGLARFKSLLTRVLSGWGRGVYKGVFRKHGWMDGGADKVTFQALCWLVTIVTTV